MSKLDWTWTYWAVFALGILAGSGLIGVVLWRLQQAFETDGLTRTVLVDSFTLGIGALAILLVSGWAFANRPTQPHTERGESLWD